MVTLTFLEVLYSLPPAFITAVTSDVLPILIRVETKPFVFAPRLKFAASGVPFFATMMLIASVLAISLVTVIGTTAPFSAISGAFNLISPLSVALELQSAASSAMFASFASKAALGHAAKTVLGVNKPALIAIPVAPAAKVPLSKTLRF